MSATPEEDVDPRIAELVIEIRDRFGVRGLRAAAWLIDTEIAVVERALQDLPSD